MKKIGFVDYYISEWHANNYPIWIKEACEKSGLDYTVAYAWAEKDISPIDGRNTAEWCKAFGAEKCDTIEELCRKSDVILVLAPSNPETHLRLAEKVLPFGKRTYIDKTFAPDYATSEKIFAIAKEHNTLFFSSSALRYASELDAMAGSDKILVTGGGGNFEEYIIHQIEPAVKVLQAKATGASVRVQGKQVVCDVTFAGGKEATLCYGEAMPFTVCAEKAGQSLYAPLASDCFLALIADILRFYESGKVSFDTNETREVMRIREALIKAKATGEKISL